MEPITNEVQEVLSCNKRNSDIMCVEDIILVDAVEASIDENWSLLYNKSTCNAFINVKYLSNIRYDPDVKYLRVHCNEVLTYINNIGDFPV